MVGAMFVASVPFNGIEAKVTLRVIGATRECLNIAAIREDRVLKTFWIYRIDIETGINCGTLEVKRHPGCPHCKRQTLTYRKQRRMPASFYCPTCGHTEPLS